MNEQTADWCRDIGGGVMICGTDMKEVSRKSQGIKWCFHCRKRHEFWWVVDAPVGISYYGPNAYMVGIGRECTDLFPGWYRVCEDD